MLLLGEELSSKPPNAVKRTEVEVEESNLRRGAPFILGGLDVLVRLRTLLGLPRDSVDELRLPALVPRRQVGDIDPSRSSIFR